MKFVCQLFVLTSFELFCVPQENLNRITPEEKLHYQPLARCKAIWYQKTRKKPLQEIVFFFVEENNKNTINFLEKFMSLFHCSREVERMQKDLMFI